MTARLILFCCCVAWVSVGRSTVSHAQSGTLAEPTSPPSPNAALHYQRALLYLQAINKDQTRLIEAPIWEMLPVLEPDSVSGEVKRLLYQGRLAARSAATGARLEICDFGIDFRSHGSATPLPHVQPMVRLGRLMTLRAGYEMTRGNWEESAVILFDGMRMGRHMGRQQTVAEAIAGLEILTNNYYALCHWAAACPEPKMVARAQRLLETLAVDLIHPTRVVTSEMSILSRRLDGLAAAYPDGPWAELILEELGESVPMEVAKARSMAVETCVARGVSRDVFESPTSFFGHLQRISDINTRFTEAAAACMTLPPGPRVSGGKKIFRKYADLAGAIGDTIALNPAELGKTFAIHEAELTVVRTALAIAAKKTDGRFPESLDEVKSLFGGRTPTSPYDRSPLKYKLLNDGKDFFVAVAETRSEAADFPEVTFSSFAPAPVE